MVPVLVKEVKEVKEEVSAALDVSLGRCQMLRKGRERVYGNLFLKNTSHRVG